jgi:hypothetical protein
MSRSFIISYPLLFNFLISTYLNHLELSLNFIFALNFGIIYFLNFS